MKIVEAKILLGQRLWGINSWFFYKGVESWAAMNPSYAGPGDKLQALPIVVQ